MWYDVAHFQMDLDPHHIYFGLQFVFRGGSGSEVGKDLLSLSELD